MHIVDIFDFPCPKNVYLTIAVVIMLLDLHDKSNCDFIKKEFFYYNKTRHEREKIYAMSI